MYIKCFSPTLLLLFDRKSTLRVRPATVTSGELSSQNLIRGSFHEKVLWTCTQWRLHITTDENSTLVKIKHVISYFSFPIFKKSLPLLQLEFLAVKVNAEHEKFNSHLAFFAF